MKILSLRRSIIAVLIVAALALLFNLSHGKGGSISRFNHSFRPSTPLYENEYTVLFNKTPPPNYSAWLSFADSRGCPIHPKYYTQIQRDFEPWRDGIHNTAHILKDALDEYNATQIGHFRGGKFDLGPREIMDAVEPIMPKEKEFRYLLNRHDFPVSLVSDDGPGRSYSSIEEVVENSLCLRRTVGRSVRDAHGYFSAPYWFEVKNRKLPVLSSAKLRCFQDIVMPSFHQVEHFVTVVDKIPWEKKWNAVFWRGKNTGGRYLPKFPWKKYHRTRLVRWAKWYGRQHPTAIFDAGLNETSPMNQLGVDIGFHAVQNCGKQRGPSEHSYCNTITQLYPLKQYVPIRKILQFKYLIVIDGHTWPDRLLWMLQSNSIVLYAGVFVDYAIWRLKPWVHYVPIKMDLSDLEEKLRWLQSHDNEAREIVMRANVVAKELNSLVAMQCYSALVLLEYSRLYHDD